MVPELLGLGVLGYFDPLGLGVPDCLLGLSVLGVLGVLVALSSGRGFVELLRFCLVFSFV